MHPSALRLIDSQGPFISTCIRSFLLGQVAFTLPSLLRIVLGSVRRGGSFSKILPKGLLALKNGLLPACSIAIALAFGLAGEGFIEILFRKGLRNRYGNFKKSGEEELKQDERIKFDGGMKMLSTFIATTVSSLLAVMILQNSTLFKPTPIRTRAGPQSRLETSFAVSPYPTFIQSSSLPSTAKIIKSKTSSTLDITLFLFVRALDSLVRGVYEISAINKRGAMLSLMRQNSDSLIFICSCWRVMWCYFYLPEKLPKSYVSWISRLARMDSRLLDILRYARKGEYNYGQPVSKEVETLCAGISTAMGLNSLAANATYLTRLDCKIVHGSMNTSSCEINAIKRFSLAFLDCWKIYLPVHLIPQLLFNFHSFTSSPLESFIKVITAVSRSSVFLATFIASIFASVCVVRTRLGPLLLPQQTLDNGLCSLAGTLACGFSIFIENKRRRRELALFVSSRALYTLLDLVPQSILQQKFFTVWFERLLFSGSLSLITTFSVHRPELVSGVVKGIIGAATKNWKQK